MKNLYFNKDVSSPYFEYDTPEGHRETIDYSLPVDKIDEDIDVNEYSVELLINPLLNLQSNVFALLVKHEDGTKQTIGYVFPVTVLDSDQVISAESSNYYYAAFYTLLSRLNRIKTTGGISSNFEDNICVAVINKKNSGCDNPLHLCIHSLRMYCYSYFVKDNSVQQIKGYKRERFFNNPDQKSIYVDLKEPKLYGHPMVDRLIRDLVNADNVIHRFVLLYQFIEFLMEDAISSDVENIIAKYTKGDRTSSEFFDEIAQTGKEKARIKKIFEDCNISGTPAFSNFRVAYRNLLKATGFEDDSSSKEHEVFYAFRGKMTHSYRRLYSQEHLLAETIQYFERLVLLIVGNYPREIY